MAFNVPKTRLANPLVLAFVSWNDPFILITDASMVVAGAVLTQVIQDEGFIIAFASHHFSKTKSNRGTTERKCMAVPYTVAHFR